MQSASAFWLLCVLFVALLAGCSRGGTTSPKFRANMPGLGSFFHEGDAETPGAASVSSGSLSFEIPAGSPVRMDAAGGVEFTPAAPVRVVGTLQAASFTGPKAFIPPAAPSPGDQADGKARWWAWVWIAVGAVAAGLGFTQGWRLVGIGGACFVAAGVCVIALSSVPGWIWGLLGVGALVAASGWAYWTFYLGPKQAREDLRRRVTE